MKRISIIVLFFSISFAKIEISTNIFPDNIKIGDSVFFQIDVKVSNNHGANYPEIQFENDNAILLDKILFNNSVKYVFSFWEVGEVVVPEIPVQIIKDGEIVKEVYTKPQKIVISSVLSDTSSTIRTIKEMQNVKLGTDLILVYICILILSIVIIIYLWKRRQKTLEKIKKYQPPLESAITRCKRRLQNVTTPFPITPESTEAYFIELSDIFREYVGSIYFIKSLEMTTSEFKIFLKECKIDEECLIETYRLLDRADLCKYAKHLPTEEEFDSDKNTVEKLIEKF
ncbi:MAG: hypothetical protein H8E71_01955 [Candidatus Marinimicrobia bacterium]|nr:hypothetical protein [Candidatus Neomarinimicrobiota bacterium]